MLYFPAAKEAKLKNPESLTLDMGFNMPSSTGRPIVPDTSKVPFTRNGDYWEAVVPIEKQHAAYAIFAVQDDKTGNRQQFRLSPITLDRVHLRVLGTRLKSVMLGNGSCSQAT